MKKIRMLHTAASPERILEAGKVYLLPDDEAEVLLTPYTAPLQEVGVSPDGKPIMGRLQLPAWRFAEEVHDPVVRPTKLPARPDPGDTGEDVEES